MRGKKLTPQEKEDKEVKKVLKNIISLEKYYAQKSIERACFRYKDANLRKRNAQKELKGLEEKIAKAKEDLK